MGPAGKIVVVEDDARLADLVRRFLTREGFEVSVESRGDAAVAHILRVAPDLVVLDIMLPGQDGLTICRRLRPDYRGPVLMLTARGDELDEIDGLDSGADDYMAKPVRPQLLLARIRTLLRRTRMHREGGQRIAVAALVMDGAHRAAEYAGREIELTGAEFDLLWFLAERPGQVVHRNTLYLALRGIEYDGVDRSIDLRISKIRKKLRDDPKQPRIIKSVRGIGYILTGEAP